MTISVHLYPRSHLIYKDDARFYEYLSYLILWLVQVPGNDNPCTLIAFATKSFNAGQIISKLHVIELGSHPGQPSFYMILLASSSTYKKINKSGDLSCLSLFLVIC